MTIKEKLLNSGNVEKRYVIFYHLYVQHRFKKIKSLLQLYQWELSVQKGGTQRKIIIYF